MTRYRTLATLLYVWLMVGFATGTVLLVGPVRWISGGMRASRFARFENALMVGVILAFVVASFLLARALAGWMGRSGRPALRWGIPAALTVVAAAALWGWLNPA